MQKTKQQTLKPQDIVVCLQLALNSRIESIQTLSQMLGISAAEVHGALKRAENSKLIEARSDKRTVISTALTEFLIHGLKYAFPPQTGSMATGVITGIAAIEAIKGKFAPTEALPHVWPSPEGQTIGIALAPLFSSVPEAAIANPQLHKALALVDAIRAGAAREKEFAVQEIRLMLAT